MDGPPAKITSYNKVEAQLQPQLPGTYVFQLQVSDGESTAADLATVKLFAGAERNPARNVE